MSVKKNILRGGLSILGITNSGLGEPLLTQNPTTNIVDKTNAIDVSTFISTSLQDGRILIGNSSNIATPVQVTGMLSLSDTGVANISANSITDAHINTGAGINYSKLTLTNSIVNNDISASANISRNKLANGNPYRVLTNNSSGTFSEASSILGSRLLISDVNGLPTHSNVLDTEAATLSGITSNIQLQLNNRLFFNSTITPSNGDIVYYTGGTWNRLPKGNTGTILTSTPSTIQWSPPPSAISTVTLSLTSTQIKTLFSTPFTLVPAQGVNTYIEVISAYYIHTYGTVAFDFTGSVALKLGTVVMTAGYTTSGGTSLNASGDRVLTWYGNLLTPSYVLTAGIDLRNLDLTISVSGSNATVGDSTGEIIVNYRVVTLSGSTPLTLITTDSTQYTIDTTTLYTIDTTNTSI